MASAHMMDESSRHVANLSKFYIFMFDLSSSKVCVHYSLLLSYFYGFYSEFESTKRSTLVIKIIKQKSRGRNRHVTNGIKATINCNVVEAKQNDMGKQKTYV